MDDRDRTGAPMDCPPPSACDPGVGTASGAADSATYAGEPPGGNGTAAAAGPPPIEAFADVASRIGELKEYASYYLAAKLDGIKVTFRKLGIYAVLGILGLIAGSAVITTAVVLLLVGLAIAIGKPFNPDQPWVGALVVGVMVLGGLAAGVIIGLRRLTNTSRRALVKKYESRQRDQRIRFGHDVRGREAEPHEVA